MPVQTQIQVRRGTASSWTSTNPTLAAGEIGFETDTGKIKVGNGSSTWSALNYVGAANAIQYVYTASAGQTTFSGADNNSLTLSYTVGAQQVFVNGVLQVSGTDYTATNGTSITLTTATIASDIVTIVAFGTFSIVDTYTQAQANATFPLNSIDKSAGKNKIINGDFGIWQRGTTLTGNGYIADRFTTDSDATVTTSQQSFTAGTAPVSGYEAQYFLRIAKSAGGSYCNTQQKIEDVRTFAGQSVTLSFWAKVSSGTFSLQPDLVQNFGSGGSGSVDTYPAAQTVTTTWTRYSYTATLPSISGKTIGTGSHLAVYFLRLATASAVTLDVWGVQLEAGSVATAFQTATGTIQGELAACQRYYQVFNRDNFALVGQAESTSAAAATPQFYQPMRIAPTITLAAAGSGSGQMSFLTSTAGVPATIGTLSASNITAYGFRISGSGFTSAFTAGNASFLWANSADVWKASAEL